MSVHDLARQLPEPETLRRLAQGVAMIDAILNEEGYRSYTFDAHWAPGEQVAVFDDGGGNSWSITFTEHGTWVRALDHESYMSAWGEPHDDWLPTIPEQLRKAASDPAFILDDLPQVSLAMWRLSQDDAWHPVHLRDIGPEASHEDNDDDGSTWLLDEFTGDTVQTVVKYAEEVDEKTLAASDVAHVLAQQALTPELVARMNPACDWSSLGIEMQRIGYPVP